MEDNIYTVSALTKYLKNKLDWDNQLQNIGIRGEISNFTHHSSGHMYFTLKDENSKLKCTFFKSYASKLKFALKNGMKVIAFGKITVYERDGIYQMLPVRMEPEGIGALHLAYMQLKEKLEKEGLFSERNKKQLPKIPRKIGIITSPTGAAVRDIINVLTRRMPNVEALLIPASVQGAGSAESIVQALQIAEKQELDVIIIGRGGGSLEELWSFNEEIVVRAVAACSVPIISGVGHETDFTLTDLAADRRAPTPSAAAELAVPDKKELELLLERQKQKLYQGLYRKLELRKKELSLLLSYSLLSHPDELLRRYRQKLDNALRKQIVWQQPEMLLSEYWRALDEQKQRLSLSNPLQFLKRGYLLAQKKGKAVTCIEEVNIGDELELFLTDGSISCTVDKIAENKDCGE